MRVTTFEGSPENVDRALQLMLNHVLPASRSLPGWQGMLGLVSFDRRHGLVLSFWDSDATLLESGPGLAEIRKRAADAGISIGDVERLEVVFDEKVE